MASVTRNKIVFINNLDSYASKHIAKYLSSCAVGASPTEEEDPDLDDEEERSQNDQTRSKQGTFQIIGTTTAVKSEENGSSFITAGFTNLTREELLHHLMESDVVIYSINEQPDQIEEASWAVSALHRNMEEFSAPKVFILISSIMTWALSKPPDPDDLEMPFIEEDYRRRKPHPNFKDHIAAEKLVVKLGKTNPSQFSTYVLASGLQYGLGEKTLHFFFKTSWLGELEEVPVFGDGSNVVPTVHITDLAGIIQNIIDRKPKRQYFLAVDDSKNTLAEIVGAVASALGHGKTRRVPKEDVYLTKELTQAEIDCLFVNLRMEAMSLRENFRIRWVSEAGIVENMERIAEEYKLIRDLLPVRICILGPPAIGKSTVAEKICKHYKLHHVKLRETIGETLSNLELRVQAEDDEDEEAQELLETLKENMKQNGGRLDDENLIQILKNKLKTKPCQNQGFVLDGFPKTYEQAQALFTDDDDGKDEDAADVQSQLSPRYRKILPDFVFSLDATDVFLKNRVLNLPERLVERTSYSQEKFLHRLHGFRQDNSDDQTVLNYFDELELHPEHIEITSDDPEYEQVIQKVLEVVGKVRSYGPSVEELEQEGRRQAEIRLKEEEELCLQIQRREEEEEEQRRRRWEEWSRALEEEKRVEEDLLEVQSSSHRLYLMETVMPTLTQGLIECCRVRPQDPVDFLADYLLQNNPESE